jgi:hypothetical protein
MRFHPPRTQCQNLRRRGAVEYGDAKNLSDSDDLPCEGVAICPCTPGLLILGLHEFNIANVRKLASNISVFCWWRPIREAFRYSMKLAAPLRAERVSGRPLPRPSPARGRGEIPCPFRLVLRGRRGTSAPRSAEIRAQTAKVPSIVCNRGAQAA